MAIPLIPCHLLAIAHTLAVSIISLNNKVDYSVFCKNYSLRIQNQHDNQPFSVAITLIAFPWCILALGIILFLLLIHCLKTVISSICSKSPVTQMLNRYDTHNVDEPLNPLTPYMGSLLFFLISLNPGLVLALFAFPKQNETGKFLAQSRHPSMLANVQSLLLLVYLDRYYR